MLQLDQSYLEAIDRQWANLAAPGVRLTGAERVAVAAETRASRAGIQLNSALSAAVVEAAHTFGANPASPRQPWVDDLASRDVDAATYVEVLSICSRVAAIDTFLYGAGHPQRPLPAPEAGDPTGHVDPDARLNGGFAPTVGPAFPTTVVSLLPGEQDVLFDLHGALYLSLSEMGRLDIVKDLDRRQLELVASRTSLINDCFF